MAVSITHVRRLLLLAIPAAGVMIWLSALSHSEPHPAPALQMPPLPAMTVVVPHSFPPQYQVDENGRPTGFAIDIMDAVARRANLNINYRVEENWLATMAALRTGQADIIPNLGITPERQRDFDFSQPVETFSISLFVRDGFDGIDQIDDLAGRPVAVVAGNTAVGLLQQRRGVKLFIHASFEEAIFALLAGEVDALVAPVPVIQELAREARVEDRLQQVGKPLLEIKRAMAVKKGNLTLLEHLDRAVAQLVDAEEYRNIYARWYLPPEPFWTVQRLAWLGGSFLIVSILGMASWRYITQRRLNQCLAKQLEELRLFQKLTIGRELRIKQLKQENARLRSLYETPSSKHRDGP